MRSEAFAELREGLLVNVLGEHGQQCIANESDVGQQGGISGAGTILAHQSITAPVIAVFDPTPVASDQSQPLLGAIVFGGKAGEVIA